MYKRQDVDLTEKGVAEAEKAGETLREYGFNFDKAYTSYPVSYTHLEHIAIVGPNGSGKSLFVDTLIGKYPLREGALQYDFSTTVRSYNRCV